MTDKPLDSFDWQILAIKTGGGLPLAGQPGRL